MSINTHLKEIMNAHNAKMPINIAEQLNADLTAATIGEGAIEGLIQPSFTPIEAYLVVSALQSVIADYNCDARLKPLYAAVGKQITRQMNEYLSEPVIAFIEAGWTPKKE